MLAYTHTVPFVGIDALKITHLGWDISSISILDSVKMHQKLVVVLIYNPLAKNSKKV